MSEEDGVEIIILLVLGLPASGKTTLCQEICSRTASSIHVCYDDLIREEALYAERKNETSPTFHVIRSFLVELIYGYLLPFLKSVSLKLSLTDIQTYADNLGISRFIAWSNMADLQQRSIECHKVNVKSIMILVDDTFHFRSMREVFFRRSIDIQNVAVVFLALDIELSSARARNNKRERYHKLPDDVVVRMNSKFEWPDAIHNPWEDASITLKDDSVSYTVLISWILTAAQRSRDYKSHLKKSRHEKLMSVKCDQIATQQSVNHQLDLHLRKIVKSMMLESPVPGHSVLSAIKKQVFSQYKLASHFEDTSKTVLSTILSDADHTFRHLVAEQLDKQSEK